MLNPTGISDPEKISSARLACAYIWVSPGEINPETTQSVPNTQIEKIAATITTEKILANLRYNLQSAGSFFPFAKLTRGYIPCVAPRSIWTASKLM